MTVLILNQGLYEETEFVGDQAIATVLFPELQLTAKEIFQ